MTSHYQTQAQHLPFLWFHLIWYYLFVKSITKEINFIYPWSTEPGCPSARSGSCAESRSLSVTSPSFLVTSLILLLPASPVHLPASWSLRVTSSNSPLMSLVLFRTLPSSSGTNSLKPFPRNDSGINYGNIWDSEWVSRANKFASDKLDTGLTCKVGMTVRILGQCFGRFVHVVLQRG